MINGCNFAVKLIQLNNLNDLYNEKDYTIRFFDGDARFWSYEPDYGC